MLNQGRLVYSVWQEKLCYTDTYCKLGEWQITVSLFNSFTAVTCLIIERFFNSLGLLIYQIGCTSRFSQSLWLILKQSYSLNCVLWLFYGTSQLYCMSAKGSTSPNTSFCASKHSYCVCKLAIVTKMKTFDIVWAILIEMVRCLCFGRQSLKSLLNTNVLSVLTVLTVSFVYLNAALYHAEICRCSF